MNDALRADGRVARHLPTSGQNVGGRPLLTLESFITEVFT